MGFVNHEWKERGVGVLVREEGYAERGDVAGE